MPDCGLPSGVEPSNPFFTPTMSQLLTFTVPPRTSRTPHFSCTPGFVRGSTFTFPIQASAPLPWMLNSPPFSPSTSVPSSNSNALPWIVESPFAFHVTASKLPLPPTAEITFVTFAPPGMRRMPGPVFTKPPNGFVNFPASVRSPVTSKITDLVSFVPVADGSRTVMMSRLNVPVPVYLSVPASM